ncbi:uncharacterized protein [Phyllobates terribilis]|uniref:uncharacterized protein n=2 Tax=Phyllobates terribilis TaxID=111132 RepID=UPI003CCB2B3D
MDPLNMKMIYKKTGDHGYIKCRKLIQATKKMDCPAKIYVYHIIRYPDFQITRNTAWHKRMASKKMNQEITKDNKVLHCYVVQFPKLSEHRNHPIAGEVANIREKIDPRVVDKILELYQSGIRKKRDIKKLVEHFVVQELFTGLDLPQSSRRRYYPTLKDITNIMGRTSKGTTTSVFDQSKVLDLVSKWQQEDNRASIYCRPHSVKGEDQDEQKFLLCYQRHWQKRLLSTYGNSITLLDATYRTTRYALPLYFLCVRTNVCYTVVAAFVVQQERTEYIIEALKMIKDWNPTWNPSCFMLDFCLEEINAIAQVFADADIKLCDFHREKAWTEWVNQKVHGVHENKKEVLALLRGIALASSREEHDTALATLTSSNVWKRNKMLRMWFSHKWLPDIKKWAHVYRTGTQQFGINTNNGLERQHQTLKHSYLSSLKNCNLSQLIRVLHFEFFTDMYQKYVQMNLTSSDYYRKYVVEVPSFLKNRPRGFIDHVMQRYYSGLDLSHLKCLDSDKGLFEVKSESAIDLEKMHTVCVGLDGPTCTCKDWQKFLLPCKHMCLILRVANWQWHDINPAYSENPLFILDSDCFVDTNTRHCDNGLQEHECRPQNSVRSDPTLHELPSRRRNRLTYLIRHCVKVLKRFIDSVYLLDNQDFVKHLTVELSNLYLQLREQIPQEGGLPLKPAPKVTVSKAIQELPVRKYGKQKNMDIHRVGSKAENKTADVWETVNVDGQGATPQTPPTEKLDCVWVTVKNIKLSFRDRALITEQEWLDDNIINACQNLIIKACPKVSGLMDTVVLAHSDIPLVTGSHIIQIHHVGAHWLVSACNNNSVTVFNSLHSSSISDTLKKQILKMYKPLFHGCNKILDVTIMCCQKQNGANDCGLFAIANAVALAEGVDLKSVEFNQAEMRSHLILCLEKGRLELFPYETKLRQKIYKKRLTLTTYCLCHVYKAHEHMVECSLCKSWFHLACVNIKKDDKLVTTRKRFYCPMCLENKNKNLL